MTLHDRVQLRRPGRDRRRRAGAGRRGRAGRQDRREGASAATCTTPTMPDPDLVIRTSGEYRISNFLLWELAYSELVFTDVLWPDFRREHLFDAVREYQRARPPLRRGRASRSDGLSALYRDQAIVLRTYKLGEADRIVVLSSPRPRQGARRRQGRAQDQEQVRRRASSRRATSRCSSTRAASSTSSPRPRRSTTSGPSARTSTASPGRRRCSRPSTRWRQEREPNARALPDAARRAARAAADDAPAGRARVLLEAARARGLPPDARRVRDLRQRPTDLVAFDLESGRRAVPHLPSGPSAAPRGARPAAAASSGVALGAALNEPASAPRPTRSTTSPPGPWSTTSSAACARSALLDRG